MRSYRNRYPFEGQVAIHRRVAADLTAVSDDHRPRAWTWRYVYNVCAGHLEAGVEFAQAIQRLHRRLKGQPPPLADTQEQQVVVQVKGHLPPGTIITGEVWTCDLPGCNVTFLKNSWNHKYCCRLHGAQHRRLKHAQN